MATSTKRKVAPAAKKSAAKPSSKRPVAKAPAASPDPKSLCIEHFQQLDTDSQIELVTQLTGMVRARVYDERQARWQQLNLSEQRIDVLHRSIGDTMNPSDKQAVNATNYPGLR